MEGSDDLLAPLVISSAQFAAWLLAPGAHGACRVAVCSKPLVGRGQMLGSRAGVPSMVALCRPETERPAPGVSFPNEYILVEPSGAPGARMLSSGLVADAHSHDANLIHTDALSDALPVEILLVEQELSVLSTLRSGSR